MFCVPPKKSREYAHIGEDGMIHIIEGTKDTVGLKSLQDNYRYKFLVQVYVIFEKVSVKYIHKYIKNISLFQNPCGFFSPPN